MYLMLWNQVRGLNIIGVWEESFAPEFKNYINSIISNKNLDINIDKLYERNFDFNEIEN